MRRGDMTSAYAIIYITACKQQTKSLRISRFSGLRFRRSRLQADVEFLWTGEFMPAVNMLLFLFDLLPYVQQVYVLLFFIISGT